MEKRWRPLFFPFQLPGKGPFFFLSGSPILFARWLPSNSNLYSQLHPLQAPGYGYTDSSEGLAPGRQGMGDPGLPSWKEVVREQRAL